MRDPILLTPGPLTTTDRVKQAMLRDWGSRDPDFERLSAFVRGELVRIGNGGDDYAAVPLQGSGTFAVEAMLGTFAPREGRLMVLANGAYGQRILAIAARLNIETVEYGVAETAVHEPAELARRLAADPSIRAVAMVHCETTSGILNPVEALAPVVVASGKILLIDAMSAFGALPVDVRALGCTALAASSNKCLQGVPGVSFVLARRDALAAARGRSPGVVLDLEAQHRQFEADGQWRYTPPTHIVAALAEALKELADEGGTMLRLDRYRANCRRLIEGMAELGFRPVIEPSLQAPIIVSFAEPAEPWFEFDAFYDALKTRGYAVYAGKMKIGGTFRVGTIGAVDPATIDGFLVAAAETVAEMRHGDARERLSATA